MTPLLAVLGVDPAWASPFNFILLVALMFIGDRLAREIKGLREFVQLQAAEIAKLEERAARKSAAFEAMTARADETLTTIALVGRSVHDKLRLLKLENDLRGDDTPPYGIPVLGPKDMQ